MIDRRKIEERGVLEVKRLIESCDLLSDSIPTQDRSMATDGRISVFVRTTEAKSGCVGDFPVQVKGRAVPTKSAGHAKHSVSAEDLRYYYEVTFGVLYFVVCGVDTPSPKVFYSSLLPFDLKPMVDALASTGRKNKVLRFKPFPTEPREIDRLCRNFLSDFQKQAGFRNTGIRDIATLRRKGEEVRRLSFDRMLYRGESIASANAFSGDTYVYAITSAGQPFPVDKLSDPFLVQAGAKRVLKCGDTTVATTVMAGETRGGTWHISFPCFEVSLAPGGSRLNYRDAGPFRQRLEAALLAKSLLEGHSLSIDGIEVLGGLRLEPGADPDIDARIGSYREVVALMDALAVKSDWDPDKFTEVDEQKVNALIASIMHGKTVRGDLDPQSITNVMVCGECIKFFAQEQDEGCYKLYDILGPDAPRFGVPLGEAEGGEIHAIPVLLMFDVEDLRKAANLDPVVFSGALDSAPLDRELCPLATRSLLAMLSAWDMGAAHPDELLASADVLCARIEAVEPGPVCVVNSLQIARRRHGELNAEQVSHLKGLASDPELSRANTLLACVFVLLEDDDMVGRYFERMSGAERAEFAKWPILNLVEPRKRELLIGLAGDC